MQVCRESLLFALEFLKKGLSGRSVAHLYLCFENSPGQLSAGLGLADEFPIVLDSAVFGAAKPEPAIFMEALARSGAVAGQTWYVGDIPPDVTGAHSVGMRAALLTRREVSVSDSRLEPDAWVRDAVEAARVILAE